MVTQKHPHYYTPEEYLERERLATEKSEYFQGEIFAMAGASSNHNVIVANTIIELGIQLKGKSCRVYPSDMRVHVEATGLHTYPDVLVVCGKPEFDDAKGDNLLNPTVIVEVLSPSTESYDRGRKFHNYQQIASLQEYLLIAQDEARIDHYTRQPDNKWLRESAITLESRISLPTIDCTLNLADVYNGVEFPQPFTELPNTQNPSETS